MRVIYANDNNIDLINSLLNKDTVVVFFTAPWCGHCKQMKPAMENVFGRFKNHNSNGSLISVSEKEMPRLSVDKEIRGFPTIRQYKNGKKISDYNGMRDEKSLSNYLAKIFNENLNLKTLNKFRKTVRKLKKKRKKKRKKMSVKKPGKKVQQRKKQKKQGSKKKLRRRVIKKRQSKKALKRRKS